MRSTLEPKLAPPGAGLPAFELFIARLLFAWRRRQSREVARARFLRERETIRDLVAACTPESGALRVLIRRPRGLEDSSRFWSVWMTLDHLRIIHVQLARVIQALAAGIVPPGKASTAAVKPDPAVTHDVREPYEQSCDAFLAAADAVPDLRTPVRFAHPWFGPLDAAGWHTLAGGHLGIHRVQITGILAGHPQAANRER
jgi:hypothetical protein